jgi:hypothetical protein
MGFERGVILALFRRPLLLVESVRAWLGMRRTGGLRPSAAYLSWRSVTAYGDSNATMSAHDLLEYLSWRREMRAVRRGGGV